MEPKAVFCVLCREDEKEHNKRDKGAQVFQWPLRLCVEEFRWESTPSVQKMRIVDTRSKRRETTRDCKGLE